MERRWKDPEFREKMRVAHTTHRHSEETKQKIADGNRIPRPHTSQRLKNLWLDPVYRDRMRQMHQSRAYPRGADHASWKGGRYTDPMGYVHVRVPGAAGADAQGYIREHRVVMAQMLGRTLLSNEHVHHVNGKKDDNRPENLMLVLHNKHYSPMACPCCHFKFLVR